jgi:hypothetical protein
MATTGAGAIQRRKAIERDDSYETAARAEINSRVEQAAPEVMASLRAFAATQARQDELCADNFEKPRLADSHPGIRPRAFAVTLEPAFGPIDVKPPLEAEFLARLEGTMQADETIAWGKFTLLLGAEARQARRDLDNARNHAGWPTF